MMHAQTSTRGVYDHFIMPFTKHRMQGEGELGEWLKQTGREVARAAGSELKSVAKDKAA